MNLRLRSLTSAFVSLIFLAGTVACVQGYKDENVILFTHSPFPQPTHMYSTSTSLPDSFMRIGDGGLLSGKPCSLPCFFGIIVGETQYTEAENILVSEGLMDYCQAIDQYQFAQEEKIGGWWCSGFAVEFNRETGIVSLIEFSLTPPVQLQIIVDRYGPPDAVSIVNMGGEHDPWLRGDVLYFQYRMVLLPEEWQKSWEYEFAPTMLIDGVIYYDEARFEEEELDGLEYFGHPWNGYGTYSPGP